MLSVNSEIAVQRCYIKRSVLKILNIFGKKWCWGPDLIKLHFTNEGLKFTKPDVRKSALIEVL